MLSKKQLVNSIFVILSAGILGGCAAVTGHNESMANFNKVLLSDKCDFTDIDEKIASDDDVILWGIQGGSYARNCEDFKKSIELFDKAEGKYKEDVDKDSVVSNVGEGTASVLVNNNVNDYEGNTYEKVMVNTYKGLSFASLNDHKNARIEFNRALDRQRRAKEYFNKEIKEKKKELKEKEKANKAQNEENKQKDAKNKDASIMPNASSVAQNKQTQDVIYKQYNDVLNGFEAYPDFVNPFTTYISGVYFLLNGDSRKARGLLKESLRMDPKNKQIKSDYALSRKYSRSLSKQTKNKYAWIIYEDGEGMMKDETNIHIPLFLFTSKALYTGIALPKIKEREHSYSYLNVNGAKTVEVCNMDNVIKTEFKKRFPMVVTEAVLNTVFKTWAQYELQRRGGLVGGLVGALYQGMTNKADVRTWTALPKTFQSTRVKLNGKPLEIKDDKNNVIKTVSIPKGKNAMIYVRSAVHGNNKVHEIIF